MTTLEHTVELLRSLVSFNTVSANSNLALIHFVEDYLKKHGVASSLTFDETGKSQLIRHHR